MDPFCGDNMGKTPIFKSCLYPHPMHDEQVAAAEVSSRKRKELLAAGVGFRDENAVGRVTELSRRSKMNEMFDLIHSIVKQFVSSLGCKSADFNPFKRGYYHRYDRVKQLEKEKVRLEEMKESIEASAARRKTLSEGTTGKSSVSVADSGDMVLFEVKAMARKGLVLDVFKVFERHKAEVLAANVTVYDDKLVVSVTALAVKTSDEDFTSAVERIKAEILRL